jgi:hypothetical protein
MDGEPMNNHQTLLGLIAQNTPPWLGIAIGHWANDPLSSIALLTAIAYNVVNIWSHLRKRK